MKSTFIPVLWFHSIRQTHSIDKYAFSPIKFDQLLSEIKKTYSFLNIDTENHLESPNIEKNQILITFDDGYKDNLTNALPILLKHQVSAIFSILPNRLGGNNLWDLRARAKLQHMTKEDLLRLRDNNQIIGSHGLSHGSLLKFNKTELRNELHISKLLLENITQTKINTYSYPYGDFDDRTSKLANEIYKYSFATNRGDPNWNLDIGHRYIKRISIEQNDSVAGIMDKISNYRII